MPESRKYTVVDLLAGVGGLSYGFSKNDRFEIILANEMQKDIAKAYTLNHPAVNMLQGDIKDLSEDVLRQTIGNRTVDVVVGGPPCQSYSTLGKRQMDARANLFMEYKRVLRILHPKACLRSRAGRKAPCMPLLQITSSFHVSGRVAPIRSRSIKPRTTAPIFAKSWRRSKTGRVRMICRKDSDLRAGSRTPTQNSGGRNPPLPSHGTLPVPPHRDASIREIQGHSRYEKEHGCRVFRTTISSTARIA